MNSLLCIIILIITLISIFIAIKAPNKQGLIPLLIGSNIVSIITSFKHITIYNIQLNASAITYVTMLTSIYLLLESFSKKEVKKIVNLNIIITFFSGLMLWIMTRYEVSLTDSIGINMKNVFDTNYRVLIAYSITTTISYYIMIYMHEKIKALYDNTFITLVTSYLLVGIIQEIAFNLISYYHIFNIKIIIKIILSTYMISLITSVIFSIYLTILSKKKVIK